MPMVGAAPVYAQLNYDNSQEGLFLISKPHRFGFSIATMSGLLSSARYYPRVAVELDYEPSDLYQRQLATPIMHSTKLGIAAMVPAPKISLPTYRGT